MNKNALSAVLGTLLLGSTLIAQAADSAMPTVKPVRGTVDKLESNTLSLITRNGQHMSIGLTDKTSYRLVSPAKLDAIEPNSFVGSAAIPQPDGSLKALEVTVFEASLRGTGEGHYGWENADGSAGTMTNGTVGELKKTDGRTLTVQYNGGEKQLHVPEDVPIAYVEPSDATPLKAGTKIVLFPDADGKHAKGIAIGKDGYTPPM
jgi:hypothetical protein